MRRQRQEPARPQYPKIDPIETFSIMGALGFNVSLAKWIVRDREPNGKISAKVAEQFVAWATIDKAYALHTKLDKPIIIATLPLSGEGNKFLIDGNHRAFKAITEGLSWIPAHILSVEETEACCLAPAIWASLKRNDPVAKAEVFGQAGGR